MAIASTMARLLVLLTIPFCLNSCATPMNQALPQPPVAAKKPHQVVSPNGTREDEYYWLRDDKREDPEMLAYIKAENAYADAAMAHVRPLQEKVYQEIIGRLQQDDSSVPYLLNGYWYYRRFETGKEYPVYARRKHVAGAAGKCC
jgi:oligopeptidase B